MILLVGSQKGGPGKSTVATNLCVWLTKQGRDVILVDADKQQTSNNWATDREEDTSLEKINTIQKYGNIKATLLDLSKRYNCIVVDVAGHDSQEMRTALLCADIVLIPTQCSQPDLDTLHDMKRIIDDAKDFNESLKVFTVFSRTPTNPSLKELEDALSYMEGLHLNPLKTHIANRKIYRDAIGCGRGVLELKNKKASVEIESLAKEICL
jgi:chromosome partitioning protein|tara:strand:+ start:465 stop:1094 length:630 start_codon:yes stop_codon:yes gene_type:complete